jgi:hypothetical protein
MQIAAERILHFANQLVEEAGPQLFVSMKRITPADLGLFTPVL